MYVLEQVEADSHKLILAANERHTIETLLSLILRARIRTSKNSATSEHLRSAQYRLKTGQRLEELITLDSEHFRIREVDEESVQVNAELAPSKRELQRLAGLVRPTEPTAGNQPSSVEIAVARSTAKNEDDAGWYISTTEDETPLDGDRFEI